MQDQRYASTYIFGAVCPHEGKGAALVLPYCDTRAMSLHLAEVATMISPGRHAVLLLDQAGWHMSADLNVPDNITVIPPLLMGVVRRLHAAIFNLCAGVTPPMPMFGRSLL